MKPRISILLTTCNLLNFTKKALASISNAVKKDYELIIVDNGSTDGTEKYLLTGDLPLPSWLSVRLYFNPKNFGVSRALNQGFNLAKADFIYWLQNDVVLKDPDYFEKLYQNFLIYKKVGSVSAMTNYVDNKFQKCFTPDKLPNDVISVNLVCNMCVMFSKSAWKNAGGFDEEYIYGNYEDTDYCMKLKQKGYQILVDRSCFIYHYGSLTFKKQKLFSTLDQNHKRFINIWGRVPDGETYELVK